jgi:hypothetical protein
MRSSDLRSCYLWNWRAYVSAKRFRLSGNGEDILPVADEEPDPAVPVIVTTVTKGSVEEAPGDVTAGAFEEEEDAVPEVPPAAADSCAKPMEGGSERSTV